MASFANIKVVNRPQLEHIIRAAAGNADATDLVIIGSQALLGSYPEAPDELLDSMEADVFPRDRPQDSILINGGIGGAIDLSRNLWLLCPRRG